MKYDKYVEKDRLEITNSKWAKGYYLTQQDNVVYLLGLQLML